MVICPSLKRVLLSSALALCEFVDFFESLVWEIYMPNYAPRDILGAGF
jgi:hypothetical protein